MDPGGQSVRKLSAKRRGEPQEERSAGGRHAAGASHEIHLPRQGTLSFYFELKALSATVSNALVERRDGDSFSAFLFTRTNQRNWRWRHWPHSTCKSTCTMWPSSSARSSSAFSTMTNRTPPAMSHFHARGPTYSSTMVRVDLHPIEQGHTAGSSAHVYVHHGKSRTDRQEDGPDGQRGRREAPDRRHIRRR